MLMAAAQKLLPALLQLAGGRPAISILGGLAGNRKIRSTKQKRHSAKAEWRRYLKQAALDKPLLSYPSLNWLILADTGNLAG
jgi:uncharacterized membrane protein YdfJ with MMPL/SSD domain